MLIVDLISEGDIRSHITLCNIVLTSSNVLGCKSLCPELDPCPWPHTRGLMLNSWFILCLEYTSSVYQAFACAKVKLDSLSFLPAFIDGRT